MKEFVGLLVVGLCGLITGAVLVLPATQKPYCPTPLPDFETHQRVARIEGALEARGIISRKDGQ